MRHNLKVACEIGIKVTASLWLLLLAAQQAQSDTLKPEVAVMAGPDWLKLIWRKPLVNTSQPCNITYVSVDGFSAPVHVDNVMSNFTHFNVTLKPLMEDSEYSVEIVWRTTSGQISRMILIARTLYIPLERVINVKVENKTRLDINNYPLPKSTVEVSWSLLSQSSWSLLSQLATYEVNITKPVSGLVVYRNVTLPDSDRVCIEQVLDHYTVYIATVRAISRGHLGPVSMGYTFRTDEGLPSLPLNFRFIGHTHNAVQVAWSPPLYVNGVPNGYELSCVKIKDVDGAWQTEGDYLHMYPTIADRVYSVTGLAPQTYYWCLLAAKNNRYLGHQEQLYSFTDYEPLAVPVVTEVVVLSTSSVNIWWTTDDHGQNTTLSAYLINVTSADSSSWFYNAVLHSRNLSMLTYKVIGLPFGPFHQYAVTVKAISWQREHLSRNSDPYLFRTAEDTPGPPVLLYTQLVKSSLKDAWLLWKLPVNSNGIIRQYQIETVTVSYHMDMTGKLQMTLQTVVKNRTISVNETDSPQHTTPSMLHDRVHVDQPLTVKHLFKVRVATAIGFGNFSNEESLFVSGGTAPRLLFVTIDVASATIRAMWLNPLYNMLHADDSFHLSVIAAKTCIRGRVQNEVLNDSRLVSIPISRAQTVLTEFKDVTLYQMDVANIYGQTEYTVQILGGNQTTSNPSTETLKVFVPPMVPPFVYAPDVLDEGFQSESGKEIGRVTTTVRTVRIRPSSCTNGNVVKYAIIVLQLPTDGSSALLEAEPVSPVSADYWSALTIPPYFAFLDDWIEIDFNVREDWFENDDQVWEWYTIGNGRTCVKDKIACNKPLSAGTSYRFKLRAYTVFNESDPNGGTYRDSHYSEPCSTKRDPAAGLIAQLSVGLFVSVMAICGVVFGIKARNKRKKADKRRRLSLSFLGIKRTSTVCSPTLSMGDESVTWL